MRWRYKEKRNDQEHHEKVSFFHLAKFWMVFFLFEKMSSSIPMLLVMLLAHVGKGLNSHSQMFSKTGALKNFAIFTGKDLFWSLFLIKFQDWRSTFLFKKRLQRRCFSVNTAKFLRTAFYWRPVHYTIINFYLMIDNWYFNWRPVHYTIINFYLIIDNCYFRVILLL